MKKVTSFYFKSFRADMQFSLFANRKLQCTLSSVNAG